MKSADCINAQSVLLLIGVAASRWDLLEDMQGGTNKLVLPVLVSVGQISQWKKLCGAKMALIVLLVARTLELTAFRVTYTTQHNVSMKMVRVLSKATHVLLLGKVAMSAITLTTPNVTLGRRGVRTAP